MSRRDRIVYALGLAVILMAQPFQATAGLPLVRLLPYIAGKLLGMSLIAFVPSLLAFYLFRRSKTAASVTFAILMFLGAAGQVHEALMNISDNSGQPQSPASRDHFR